MHRSMMTRNLQNFDYKLEDEPVIDKEDKIRINNLGPKKNRLTIKRKNTSLVENVRTSMTLKKSKSKNAKKEVSRKVKVPFGDRGLSYYKQGGGAEMDEHANYLSSTNSLKNDQKKQN
jgi:hypothetical protein